LTSAISGSFVRDLVLPTSERDASEVAHVVAAIGSRSIEKAEQFIKDNCPEGGSAQKEGLSEIKTAAKGSYKDCVEDPVSLPSEMFC
jgi:dihydrodiol dehydrogenase / D-xylose 1-dehydrogenase (NADP)